MDSVTAKIVTVITLIIGLATVAVLVSKQANTSGVLKSAGDAFGSILGTALKPVTGSGTISL